MRRNFGLFVGITIVSTVVLMAIFAPLLAPYSPTHVYFGQQLVGPFKGSHLLGTDNNGFDILSRLIYAPRVDLVVPVIAMVVSFVIGVPLGGWIGYHAGRRGFQALIAGQLMRAVDILQAFPIFVLALALAAVLGRGEVAIGYALIVLQTPVFLRLTRSSVQAVRRRAFVDAAKAVGNSERRVIMRHVIPNAIGPALVNASNLTGGGILITASLSFIGAGVSPPTPEWGYMVSDGAQTLITGAWWPALFPGIFIGVTVLGFALIGDSLTNLLNPDRRR